MILWAISEHIEKAGVHSGDATLVFPAQRLSVEVLRRARKVGEQLAQALQITGPFNVQMLVKHGTVKVIECNLRASRSFPLVSKVSGVNFIREATRAMLGAEPSRAGRFSPDDLDYVAVKAPQFSFDRLRGADPSLGVEMTSTGEVACFGATRDEALLKAMLAAGFTLPSKGALLALDAVAGSTTFFEEATILRQLGLEVFATPKTAEALCPLGCVQDVSEEDGSAQQLLHSGKVDVVFSDPGVASASENRASAALQRLAIDLGISVVGEAALTRDVIQARLSAPLEALEVKPWKHYVSRVSAEPTRRAHLLAHGEDEGAGERRIRLFIRQPLTETSPREAAVVQGVLDVLQQINGSPYALQFLNGHQAQSLETFRRQFEREAGQPFTPASFRETRLDLLNHADVMMVIRTGLSESGAFEVAYNIFGGKGVPVFFAVWDQAPIKTTLLRDLDELVPVRYVTFSRPEELRQPLLDFLSAFAGIRETDSAAFADLGSWEAEELTAPVVSYR